MTGDDFPRFTGAKLMGMALGQRPPGDAPFVDELPPSEVFDPGVEMRLVNAAFFKVDKVTEQAPFAKPLKGPPARPAIRTTKNFNHFTTES